MDDQNLPRPADNGQAYPPVPGSFQSYPWRIAIPPIAATRIARGQYVFRLEDGRLVCAVVERIASEWEHIRRGNDRVTGWGARRLLDTMTYLIPGAGQPLPSEGAWHFDGDDDEGRWIEDVERAELGRTSAAYCLAAVVARGWRTNDGDRRRVGRIAEQRQLDAGDVKVELCAAAILAVAARESEPQRVRIGRHNARGSDGELDSVRPTEDIDARSFLRWFFAATIRDARTILRGDRGNVYTAQPDHPGDSIDPRDEPRPDWTEALVTAIRSTARPEDQPLLDAIAEHGTIACAARAIGMDVERAKKRVQRLRSRMLGSN